MCLSKLKTKGEGRVCSPAALPVLIIIYCCAPGIWLQVTSTGAEEIHWQKLHTKVKVEKKHNSSL